MGRTCDAGKAEEATRYPRESWIRAARTVAFLALGIAAHEAMAEPMVEGRTKWRSACADEGLAHPGSGHVGCEDLGRRSVEGFGDRAIYWHIARLTGPEIAAGMPSSAWIVEAENEAWSYTFGPRDQAPPHGEPVATIGPLPLAPAARYEVVAYVSRMAPGKHTAVHTHPGPEAWYLLSGEQCVETPTGASRVAAGESMVAPASVPMRLTSTGSGTRRALAIVVHDPAKSQALPSDWLPRGGCEKAPPRVAEANASPPVVAASAPRPPVSFAGRSLDSTLAELRPRYRYPARVDTIAAPEDSGDSVHGVHVPSEGEEHRIRITFERRPGGGGLPASPPCGEIEAMLERSYGPPSGVRHFFEGASMRADRIWKQKGERLELVCIGESADLRAEAIVISRASR